MIKYIGSKRLLVPQILQVTKQFSGARSVLDVFSGTSRVGHGLKRAGYFVTANDHNSYAYALARCYIQADRDEVIADVQRLLPELQRTHPKPGYFTETFCERSRFFHPKNGALIDAIRERIDTLDVAPDVRYVLLVALMEAADRVDSTTGLQMAYLKSWAPRALNDLELKMPHVLPGGGLALQMEAVAAAGDVHADVAYLDPPYNQHSYLSNYHIWETLIRWDKPEVYGVACKRLDCRDYTSPFNSRPRALTALAEVIRDTRAPRLVVSLNDEGFLTRQDIEPILAERGYVSLRQVDSKRYVGAQIGIHNAQGKKVGTVGRLRNREFLFAVTPDAREHAALERPGGEETCTGDGRAVEAPR